MVVVNVFIHFVVLTEVISFPAEAGAAYPPKHTRHGKHCAHRTVDLYDLFTVHDVDL